MVDRRVVCIVRLCSLCSNIELSRCCVWVDVQIHLHRFSIIPLYLYLEFSLSLSLLRLTTLYVKTSDSLLFYWCYYFCCCCCYCCCCCRSFISFFETIFVSVICFYIYSFTHFSHRTEFGDSVVSCIYTSREKSHQFCCWMVFMMFIIVCLVKF